MLAPISERTNLDTTTPRRFNLEDAPIETLFFVDLNATPVAAERDERDLPEELTGFYYTG